MVADDDSPLAFPCDFPIKVMGRDEADDFREMAVAIVEEEIGPLPAGAVNTQPSRNGRFLSVTVTIRAESREQLDALYRRLSSDERVLVVL
ncbi:MAG: DUF493 domain-containing protein [Gammaproteobacteria bacterium]|jgi:putative lipoic acid-binding regulatory protein